jgi:hypothetical protein
LIKNKEKRVSGENPGYKKGVQGVSADQLRIERGTETESQKDGFAIGHAEVWESGV